MAEHERLTFTRSEVAYRHVRRCPSPPAGVVRCAHCRSPLDPGDTFVELVCRPCVEAHEDRSDWDAKPDDCGCGGDCSACMRAYDDWVEDQRAKRA